LFALVTGPAPAEPGAAGLLELIALSATCRALRAMLTAADDVWAPFLARLEVGAWQIFQYRPPGRPTQFESCSFLWLDNTP